jgi:phospholipase C
MTGSTPDDTQLCKGHRHQHPRSDHATLRANQVPVLSALARNFAFSDASYSSVPSNTWPNRSFFHAGTSNGNVVNRTTPDPMAWNVPTIFNVLEAMGVNWRI